MRKAGKLVGDGTYLTVGEAIERLNAEPRPVPIKNQTLRRMAERGDPRMLRIGLRRDRRFLATEINALKDRLWAEAHPVPEPDATVAPDDAPIADSPPIPQTQSGRPDPKV